MEDRTEAVQRRLGRPFATALAVAVLTGVATIAVAVWASAERGPALVERRAWAMGTEFAVTVRAADRDAAVEASETALRAVAAVEARLSTWHPESELSRFNAAVPGTEVAVSPGLLSDLREATRWWDATGGAFDPGIAGLVAAWDLRGAGRVPSEAELASARASSGWSHIALGPHTARFDVSGFGVEEGGFGKGIALRASRQAALAAGALCVVLEFGGQIEIGGECGELSVEIADPVMRDRALATLTIGSGSVATSGNSERGLEIEGIPYGHLLDPRSGRPVRDWGAVTVVTDDPIAADCLSTALYVMGPRRGQEWVRERFGVEAIFVERDGAATTMVTATPGLDGRLELSSAVTGTRPKQR